MKLVLVVVAILLFLAALFGLTPGAATAIRELAVAGLCALGAALS